MDTTTADIHRHAHELTSAPTALETLLAIFEKVEAFPSIRKYRQFKASGAMASKVLSEQGARSLLASLGYVRDGDFMALSHPEAPLTLGRLRTAISALRAAKASDSFARAANDAELPAHVRAERDARAAARSAHKRRAPPEPASGDGGVCSIRFLLSDADGGGFSTRVVRRFRADDTFDGVLAFARGDEALSAWSDEAPLGGESGEGDDPLVVRDVTTRREPPPILTASADGGRTLQALGFWPSARLELTTDAAVTAGERGAPPPSTTTTAAADARPGARPKPSAMLKLSRDGTRFAQTTAGAREHHRVHGARANALRAAEERRAQEERDLLIALRMQQDEEDALSRRQREVGARA